MPLNVEEYLDNNIDKYEHYEKQEMFINLWSGTCAFLNNIVFGWILGIISIIYIAIHDFRLALIIFFFVITLGRALNRLYELIKGAIINFVSLPLYILNKKSFLLLHFIVDLFICWYLGFFISGLIMGSLRINTSTAFFMSIISGISVTSGIFLLETGRLNVIELSKKDKVYNTFVNYNLIFKTSLYLSALITFPSLIFQLSKTLSLALYLIVYIIPQLAYIILEMCRKDPNQNIPNNVEEKE